MYVYMDEHGETMYVLDVLIPYAMMDCYVLVYWCTAMHWCTAMYIYHICLLKMQGNNRKQ